MSESDRRSVRVCLIAESCLAEGYLRNLLREYSEVEAISLRQYAHLSPIERARTIFVIDLCGLEVPLYECLEELRARSPSAKFLLLGNEKSREELLRLLSMGAQGYVPYPGVARNLAKAIFSVAANRLWVSHEVLQAFLNAGASALHKDGHARNTATPRENQILELVRRRLSNREIAERLQIQVSTVKFHLSNIFSKMYASSRGELMEAPSSQVSRTLAFRRGCRGHRLRW
jgi:DNA-binding NarL/FixJ family response regulator